MDQGRVAVGLGAKCDALFGGVPTDDAVHALARQQDAHWPPAQPGSCNGEDLMVPKPFAAESTANIRRQNPDLLLL